MACGLCPGYFGVYYWDPDSGEAGAWVELENVDSWNVEANVQEATKKRTSSTNGVAVKFCSDVVDFTASVTTTLCKDTWLFCDILGGNGQTMGSTKTTWFYFGWGDVDANGVQSKDPPSLTPTTVVSGDSLDGYRNGTDVLPPGHADNGLYLYGSVVPPGFGGDNTNTDPSTATFTVNVSSGPILPLCVGRAVG